MNEQTVEQSITLMQAWEYGGSLMWVLLGMSVIALALILYLFMAHRRGAITPAALLSDILNSLHNNDAAEAKRLCERSSSALADVALAGVLAVTMPGATLERINAAVETAGAHAAGRMSATVEYLLDIATIAPLVGLLGTVLGMFKAFSGVANDVATAKPVVLAQGVSQAIITTVFGLVVSIPVLVAYAFFRRRVARRTDELENAATEVVDAMVSKGR